MAGKAQGIVAPLAQRRNGHREDVEAEEQVLAEDVLLNQAEQVLVGRRDDAHVDLAHAGVADHADFPVLQDTEEFDLHRGTGLADFVQEDRTALGGLEETGAGLGRAGERTSDIAEELAFQQPLGYAATVYRHEWSRGTRAGVVNRPGHQFLAGAAFAGNQHRGRRGCGPGHGRKHVLHRFGFAQDAGVCGVRLQGSVVRRPTHAQFAQRPVDRCEQLLIGEWFGQELLGPGLDRLHCAFDRRVAGNHHHLGVVQILAHVPNQVHPADPRHLKVGDDEVNGSLVEQMESF